jgi:sporulation-control protein spo0M
MLLMRLRVEMLVKMVMVISLSAMTNRTTIAQQGVESMFDLLKSGKASVKLTLDRPIGPDSIRVNPYFPGDMVHACVRVMSEKDLKIKEGRVALVYQEEYQYKHYSHSGTSRGHSTTTVATTWATEERECNRQVFLGETQLPAGTSKTYEFDLPIPAGAPPSARGEIIHISWAVKATLDRQLAGDIQDREDLPVYTRATAPSAQPGELGVSSEPDEAGLSFSLPVREFVMGETIAGRLFVSPEKEFDVTEIRVELVRRERVPRGLGNERETSIPCKLSERTHLQPGQTLAFPFNLKIPSPAPATFSTPNASLIWVLKGVLARRLRKDTIVELEIGIYNI